MAFDEFTQMTLTGVNLGLMYALIAIGLTLIFGVMRIIQYAHGELFMLGAYVLYYWFGVLGWPYWLGVAASAVVIFVFGAILQLLLFRPLHGKNILYSLAVSMGLIFIISSGGLLGFGTVVKGIPSVISGGVMVFGAFYTYERMVISIFSAVLLLSLWFFLQKTTMGMAMRAVSEDPEVSALQGINTRRIHWVAFGLGSAMAAVAGCLMGTLLSIVPTMGFAATIKAFMIVIMGGLGSVLGALIGGLILGFIDSFVTTLISADIAYIMGFVVIFVILVFKPAGLFGQQWE
ncbi:MAG: branched-chain amino acid ABC transporter permease [Gammaproteobacteria bacterium]|nr:branched-chain amino acid ABC transporter permease [Gammaproteobacteria bacterium]